MKFIAMRCAGYDRVDVQAANSAGIQVNLNAQIHTLIHARFHL